MAKKSPPTKSSRTYYIEEKNGRFYVHCLEVAPVDSLFDITQTREQAEKAIDDYKQGKHATQQ